MQQLFDVVNRFILDFKDGLHGLSGNLLDLCSFVDDRIDKAKYYNELIEEYRCFDKLHPSEEESFSETLHAPIDVNQADDMATFTAVHNDFSAINKSVHDEKQDLESQPSSQPITAKEQQIDARLRRINSLVDNHHLKNEEFAKLSDVQALNLDFMSSIKEKGINHHVFNFLNIALIIILFIK